MEGVVDPVLRELLTEVGHIDVCVTEFVRVTNHLHSEDVFRRYCPELPLSDATGDAVFSSENRVSRTHAGTPVLLQLLGSDIPAMAENAAKAAELGAFGIDLNFGCPAKTVNNHDGGAALLKAPERMFQIIEAVRTAVPRDVSVSAKIRLGFDCKDYVTDIAQATEAAGATWLCIHARTKVDGYKPPAYWEYIAPLTRILKIPIIANGEVWSKNDHALCVERSNTPHVMIGRGLVANPGLAQEIQTNSAMKAWCEWQHFVLSFMEKSCRHRNERYAVQRTKQLTKMMGQTYGESVLLHEQIKRLEDYALLVETTKQHFLQVQNGELLNGIETLQPRFIVPRALGAANVVPTAAVM